MLKQGYKFYELEPDVFQLLKEEKKVNGVNREFTINAAIRDFFEHEANKDEEYQFDPEGRKPVHVHINSFNAERLYKERVRMDEDVSYNHIVNASVKFYLNRKNKSNE